MIADAAGVPLYVVHVSCEQAHEAIRRARQKGMRVFGEPLIQFLTLDESEYFNKDWEHAARRVMSPPFRDKSHQDGLWAGLQSGSLQVVATDHAAFSTEQKRMGVNDFTKIPNGSNGLEERLSVLWTEGVETGRLTRQEFVAITSSNIAKILNIYPKKGAILEVQKFIRLKVAKDKSASKAIGIKEIREHLEKKIPVNDVIEKISIKTRQYAKRQSTWGRNNMKDWNKINPKDLDKFLKKI